jgi:glutathione-regulated potassium-efflux system protein KefB
VDDKAASSRIVELIKHSFALTPVLARAFDRQHAIELLSHGVDYQLRETFESALLFGQEALRQLGVDEGEAQAVAEDIRRRDTERLQLEMSGERSAALALLHGNRWTPTPLSTLQRGPGLEPGGRSPGAPWHDRRGGADRCPVLIRRCFLPGFHHAPVARCGAL